ncbi:MAG: SurA N-terminal domain-containing protein [Candidatus Moraniibacteriota bacterium]
MENVPTLLPEGDRSKAVETPKTESVTEKPIEKTTEVKTKPAAFHIKVSKKAIFVLIAIVILVGLAMNFKKYFIAASVNGHPISRLAVIQELEKRSGEQVVNSLITKRLIQDEAAKRKIVESQADVDQEIKKVEDSIGKQGNTLEEALSQQGMTLPDFREQIMIQKLIEKILGDKLAISDDEVTKYIADNKIPAPKDVKEEDFRNQIKDQLKNQKLNTEANKWVTDAKAKATIEYLVDYAKPEPSPVPSAPQPGDEPR